jgi:DnaJ-class molecular chaperone
MKRILFAALAVLFAVTVQAAATAPAEPKILKSEKQGDVTFKHDTHKAVACEKCHGAGEPKAIGKMEKEKAHALCSACHKEGKKGPTKCTECHKK